MTSIIVKSLPLKDVIKDIANALEVTYFKKCQEFILEIPEKYGNGTIRGINFDSGLGIIQYDCSFNQVMEFQFSVQQIHPLKFIYVISGILQHRFEHNTHWKEINQYQSTIVASSNFDGHVLRFKKNERVRMNSLEIDRQKFEKKMSCEIEDLDSELGKLFKDKKAEQSFYHNGTFSLNIADLFKTMDQFQEVNFVRKLFLEGISYQLLTQQILQYRDDKLDDGNRSLLRLSELNQIRRIASLIENRITEVSTVENLAANAGMNVNKLQEGFKYLYQNTVNGFVQKIRLEYASKLLNNSDCSISEIVSSIGLNSKSYFSKIFKEKYGISPSEYRKRQRSIS